MQNPIPKFRQSSIISEKSGYLSEKFKTLTSSNYHKIYYFLMKFCTGFLLNNVCKRVLWIFFILFRSWVNKNVKKQCIKTRFIFANNSKSKQNTKKSRTPFCRHWEVGKVSQVSAKNIELYASWSSSKFSIFQTKHLVLENNRAFSKFLLEICIT